MIKTYAFIFGCLLGVLLVYFWDGDDDDDR